MIKVLNKKHLLNSPLPRVARVYVGRPTALGNPFKVGPDGNLQQVLEKYREWLHNKLKTKNQTAALFNKILGLAKQGTNIELVCWCAPAEGYTAADALKCHAQVVAQLLEQKVYNHAS